MVKTTCLITALRSLDTPDTVIIEKITAIYHISEEKARNYIHLSQLCSKDTAYL